MAKNTTTSGVNHNIELVAPVKILVKPGLSGTEEATSSLRRRSITSIPLNETFYGSCPTAGRGENENIFLVNDQVHSSRNEEERMETSIQIENQVVCDARNVAYYLRHCFRLMYFTGMSTYNPEKIRIGREETWMDTILIYIQKIFFWVVTSVSLFFSGIYLKHTWILFALDPGVPRLVYVGSWIFTIASEIYYIHLFAFSHKRINEIMLALRELDSRPIGETGKRKWMCKNPTKLIILMFVASIFACFVHPIGRFGIQQWSPQKLIMESSKSLSIRIFVWSQNDFNSTKLPTLRQEYGTATILTFFMGMSEIGMRFWSNMKMDTALNVGIVAAILIWIRNRYFGKKVKNIDIKNSARGDDVEELDSPTGLFAEFMLIRKENRMLNGLVGGLLKIIHAYNLIQCTTFLMRCLDKRATIAELVFLVYDLMKVAVMYYFGKKAESFNGVYEQWIIDWSMQSTNQVFLGRVPAILQEMKNEPLGLGRGNFLVGQGFIFRFLGFVGSVFMLEVDDDDEE